MNNHAKSLDRGIDLLLVIKNTYPPSAKEVQLQVMPNETIRTVQRYLKGLCEVGLIYGVSDAGNAPKYYLTGKALQLFGGISK